ncbi:MAG: ferrochelatase, partial [Actinomycetota bacterium]
MSSRSSSRKGILVMAYGTPGSLDDVEPYYTDIRGG